MAKQNLFIKHEFDFILIGLVCHLKDYRLCFSINKGLEMELKKIDHLEIFINKRRETSSYSLYSYEKDDYRSFYIVSNKGSKSFLIPEQKQLDYFLLIKGITNEEKKEIIQKLKQIPSILGAYDIDPIPLKSKENLLFF